MRKHRADAAAFAAAVLLPTAVYLLTMAPSVYFGDSGELNTAAFSLGLAHVPGYPLYTLVGKLATFLPLGGIDFRMNLLSVLCSGLAIGFVYLLCYRLTGSRAASLACALALAFAFTPWEQSLKSRAYPMNLLVGVAVLHLAVRWWQGKGARNLLAAWFLFGLGLGNHEILLVTAVPLAALMIARRGELSARTLFFGAFLFALGLSVYLYLPIRSAADPLLDWGDPETLPRLLDVLLQRQYSHKILNPDLAPKVRMAGLIARSLATEMAAPAFALGLVGLVVMARRAPALLAGLVGMVLANVLLRVNYIGDWEFSQIYRYLINSYMALAIAAAFGLAWVFEQVERRAANPQAYAAVAWCVSALVVLSPLVLHWNGNRLTHHWLARDYARSLLQTPAQGALLFVGGDNDIYPLWDLQATGRYREDVVVMGKAGFYADWLRDQWGARTDPAYFDAPAGLPDYRGGNWIFYRFFENAVLAGRFPVYSMYNDAAEPEERERWALLRERFDFRPDGLPLAVSAPGCEYLFRDPPHARVLDTLPLDTLLDTRLVRDAHTVEVLKVYRDVLVHQGDLAIDDGGPREASRLMALALLATPEDLYATAGLARALAAAGDLPRARELLEEVAARGEADASIWLNLGRIRRALGDETGAQSALERARELAPEDTHVREALDKAGAPREEGGEQP